MGITRVRGVTGMKYKEFWVKTGTKVLTNSVCMYGEYLGYKRFYINDENSENVYFCSDGDYLKCNCSHTGLELPIQEFFTLTKEDVIMSKPETKQDLLHRLDSFFTKLLAGEIEIDDRSDGLCDLLNNHLLSASKVFSEVIDATKWDKFSGRVAYPVPLYDVNPETAYDTHDDLWDKKHPYGRNRWEFIEWCHKQVKLQIEQSNRNNIEFPVLAKSKYDGMIVLFTDYKTGFNLNEKDHHAKINEIFFNWVTIADTNIWEILKTAKELGLQVRGDK